MRIQHWSHRLALIGVPLGWLMLAVQFVLLIRARDGGLVSGTVAFLSYFTILTNILATTALTVELRSHDREKAFLLRPENATAIAASISLVGIGYNLLLRHLWQPQGLQRLADEWLHVGMPSLFLAYWWVTVPGRPLRARVIVASMAYPVAYFLWALTYGRLSGGYPYPFIDVGELGYVRVLVNAIGMLVVYFAVAFGLVGVARWRSRSGAER